MKRRYLFTLLLALLAIGCSKETSESESGSFVLEVILPEGTASADVVSVSGPCFDGDQALTPRSVRVRTIEIDPSSFVSGKTMADGFWFVSEAGGRELDAADEPVVHRMNACGGYTYQVKVDHWTRSGGEDITPRMVSGNWSLVGTWNEWRLSLGYPLVTAGDNRILQNVNCSGSDAFKLVLDGTWEINLGYGEPLQSNIVSAGEITLVRDGGTIRPAAGMYTLTFNPQTCVLVLDKTGEYIAPPEPDDWAIAGAFNGWDPSTAISLTRQKGGLYTASYVTLALATADDGDNAGFLLVKNGSMEGNLGLAGGTGTVTLGSETQLAEEGGRMFVPKNGHYDFSLDPSKGAVTITESPAAKESSWSIVGKFNDWDPTTGVSFYVYGGWHIAYNVELTLVNGTERGMGFKFVKNKSWDNNRGVSGLVGGEGGYKVVDLDSEISLSQGGGNIQLQEEGFYDVYMNAETDKAYILKAGQYFLH